MVSGSRWRVRDWLFWAVCTLLLTAATLAVIAGAAMMVGLISH